MKKCPKCKQEIENNSVFCEYCGFHIKKFQNTLRTVGSILAFVVALVLLYVLIPVSKPKSRQFTEMNEAIEKTNKRLADATSCEEVSEVVFDLLNLFNKEYDEADRMNEKEDSLITSACDRLQSYIDDKIESLGGCVEEDKTEEKPKTPQKQDGQQKAKQHETNSQPTQSVEKQETSKKTETAPKSVSTAKAATTRNDGKYCLFFAKNSSKIKSTAGNKATTEALFKEIAKDDVERVAIEVWESVDENDGFVSLSRAETVKKMVVDQLKKMKINVGNINITTSGYGADWDHLREMVSNSNIGDKDAIIATINHMSGVDREKKIRELIVIYPEMETIMAQMRCAEVYVFHGNKQSRTDKIQKPATGEAPNPTKQVDTDKKVEEREESLSFRIHGIEVANTYRDGSIQTSYGSPIYSSNTMYIKPRVVIECFNGNCTMELDTKVWRSDGSLVTTEGSNGKHKPGYTTTTNINMNKGIQTINMRTWGGSDYQGNWMAGDYRCEIYYEGELIYAQMIHIY